ncbi:MAG TPA: twin-arginine translocation signal domain-containing protein, partial [Candidatus Acidoferrum sp.]|nr:twin-arginine translocation signal domain-containing protein [Candidatus Acidoferrum sp.]
MKREWTRRGFCKAVGVATLATAAGPSVWVRRASAAGTRTVTLMTWSHFVPPFNPEVERQLAEWSKLRGVEARV